MEKKEHVRQWIQCGYYLIIMFMPPETLLGANTVYCDLHERNPLYCQIRKGTENVH